MSIDTVTTRLRDIQQGIADIKKAYAFDETPAKLAVTPCFTNFPGKATHAAPPHTDSGISRAFGNDVAAEERDYEMELWAAPINGPADLAAQAKRLQVFVERTKARFYGRPQLEGLTGCLSAKLVADTGPLVQEYGGKEYAYVGFTVRVTFLEDVTYGGGD